nr:hypothetical protein [uncultured Flavobacterium sp.]
MKKITLLLIMFTAFCYAQDKPNGTTLEEYNYMTKGYKVQISSGLDMKQGYKVEDIIVLKNSDYAFNFKNLVRTVDNSSAGVIVIATSNIWANTYYLSIPINNSDLMNDFNVKMSLWDESMTTAYASASTNLNSIMFDLYNKSILK